jgi:hypothetical protein
MDPEYTSVSKRFNTRKEKLNHSKSIDKMGKAASPSKTLRYNNAKPKYLDCFKESTRDSVRRVINPVPKKAMIQSYSTFQSHTAKINLPSPKNGGKETPTLTEVYHKKRAQRLQERKESKREVNKSRHTLDQSTQNQKLAADKRQDSVNKGKESERISFIFL